MATQQEMLEQLVRLTSAVQSLAEQNGDDRRERAEVTDADRVRQRVAFGYQALGALTGRVGSASGREFDVHVLRAERGPGVIRLDGLPHRAEWVELRRGTKVELLAVREDPGPGGGVPVEASSADEADDGSRRRHRDRGAVFPRLFADEEEIGSVVALRSRRGPLVAFGPRLRALPSFSDCSTA